jgi:hypothetical protein
MYLLEKIIMKIIKNRAIVSFIFISLLNCSLLFAQTTTLISVGGDGRLVYTADARGNVVPDFSAVGYKNSEAAIPTVPVVLTVSAVAGDNTANVQNAIDTVAALPIQPDGFRGAILFGAGTYNINSEITISDSGIVLRGIGTSTEFVATGTVQYDLIIVGGSDYITEDATSTKSIVDAYVPIGTKQVTVESGHTFAVNDWVVLHRIPNAAWIALLDMAQFGWTPGSYSIKFQRQVTAVNGNTITLDCPVVDPIDPLYAVATLTKFTDQRINNVGIENMKISSTYRSDTDELHGWSAIKFKKEIRDAWVKNVDCYYFGYGLISIKDHALFITIIDCNMYDPKSQTSGGRKYSFASEGQRILFKNCFARRGRHSFVNHSQTAGPNVFTNCVTQNALADDGPHHRWSTGCLYDNVDTRTLNFQNRTSSGTGHGWAAAQCMAWNCEASGYMIIHEIPSDHTNWAIGCITPEFRTTSDAGARTVEPLGVIESEQVHIAAIPSLFEAQLSDRLDLKGTVVAGDDLVAILTEGVDGVVVTMDASVVDEDTTENSWTFTKDPVGIADPTFSVPVDALDVTVTFTEAGIYTLTLTADDGKAYPVSDSLVVTVYANSCAADKGEAPKYTETMALEKGDTNWDCKVDLIDFATMAENWMIDVSLSH